MIYRYMSDEYLYQKLKQYGNSDYYPFHMPGHKRRFNSDELGYNIDITEIPEFDNLHHPEGILAEGMNRTATLFGARKSFYLVNGSTCGILSAVSTVFTGLEPLADGEYKLLMARNCHKSVYHALLLNRISPVYLYPEYEQSFHLNGGIKPEDVERALSKDDNIKAVLITSPTYDGIVSDIEQIVKIAHKHRIPVIVDEAHGAHFPLDEHSCISALEAGADLVMHSLHKMLPCMTQTALIHLQGDLVDCDTLQQFLEIYQTSSPSYVLMASIDECIRYMQESGKQYFDNLHTLREEFRRKTKNLQRLRVLDKDIIGTSAIVDLDDGKIIISTAATDITGENLAERLRVQYHIQMEMSSIDYVVGILTGMDTREGIDRLASALHEIDDTIVSKECNPMVTTCFHNHIEKRISEIANLSKVRMPLNNTTGQISAEFVYAYPPGIPIIIPGEIITDELMKYMKDTQEIGIKLQGLSDISGDTILVVRR